MMLTKEQLEERRNFIGGSDAAAVLGLSRYSTPLEIWAVKTGQIAPKEEETLPMWVGTNLEEIVARRFTIETGKKVHCINETLYHKQYPFLACHLDRKVEGENAILECKTASAFKYREWEDEAPVEYLIQVYHQLACSGYKKAYIACLIGNAKFVIKEIVRDEKVIADLVKKEVDFWENFVKTKTMPGQILANDSDILYQLFPQAKKDEEIELTDQANAIIESLDSLQADKRVLEKEIEKQKNELKVMLKDAEVGNSGIYQVSWKNQVRKMVDIKLLKEKSPEVYAKHLLVVESRVLRIRQIREGE